MLVSDIEIEVIKKNIKNMHLAVLPPLGKVRISAPLRTKDEAIKLFEENEVIWLRTSDIFKELCDVMDDREEYYNSILNDLHRLDKEER